MSSCLSCLSVTFDLERSLGAWNGSVPLKAGSLKTILGKGAKRHACDFFTVKKGS